MKIRSIAELEEAIDRDLAKRKRALTSLKFAFEGARDHQKEVLGYGAVCLLYAHWEGFVKFSGKCFTNYVGRLGLSYEQMSNGLVATCLRSRLKRLRATNKISLNRELVELLRDGGSERPTVPWQAAIEAYDNLNSEVLIEILTIIGCDHGPYLTKSAFIDEKLLRHRNSVAHEGYSHDFDISDIPGLHSGVVSLMEQLRNDIQNAATLRLFEKLPNQLGRTS